MTPFLRAWIVFSLTVSGLLLSRTSLADNELRPPTLDDVLNSVEKSLPLLKAAEVEALLAEADVLSAEGGFDLSWKTRGTTTAVGYYEQLRVDSTIEKPTSIWGTSGFVGYKLGRGQYPVYDGRLQTLEYGEVRAGVNVPLWRNGPIDRRRASLARAELGRDVASLTIKERRIELRRAAANRYWTWVGASKRLEIAESLLANVVDRDAGLAERVARGDLPLVERTDNQRAVEQRRAQVVQARRLFEQSAIELSLYLRDETGKPKESSLLAAAGQKPEIPEPAARRTSVVGSEVVADISFAASNRPEARRLKLELRRNEVELEWIKNQLGWGIDLQVVGSQDIGRSLLSRPDLTKPVVEVSLLLDVPIQTRAMTGRRDATNALLRRTSLQSAFAEDRIEADVRDAHSAIRAAAERIAATKQEVSIARSLEDAERLRFAQGDSHLLIVNLREQQTAEAQLREIDSLTDYHRALADLKAARGE